MKKLLTGLSLMISVHVNAQITGSDTVCAGYLYIFNASIAGADSFVWSTPAEWVIFNGVGTSQIEVLVTQFVGQVCVDGYDSIGNFITQFCHSVNWGGSSQGWDIGLFPEHFCQCPPYIPSIQPNGTGNNCGGCGNGFPSQNIVYAVYDGPWPTGNFVAIVDGFNSIIVTGLLANYFVYEVDVTFGINNAILIDGGACPATINNTFSLGPCIPLELGVTADPNPFCVGDTTVLRYDGVMGTMTFFNWVVVSGNVTLLPPFGLDSILCVANAATNASIELQCLDAAGCGILGFIHVGAIICANPVASFISTTNPICPGTCTNFTNLSVNATSYQWIFPAANPPTDTAANPANICYNIPGSYDVTLIATNASGTDTLIMQNYITVYPYPPAQIVFQSGDTLISNVGFASYQWYYNGNIIAGATDSFYVATQNGDYNLISTDANGCEVENAIVNVMVAVFNPPLKDELTIWPDPAGTHIAVRSAGLADHIRIYNMVGKECLSFTTHPGSKTTQIDLTKILPGVYFLELSGKEGKYYRRFMKQ